MVDPLKPKIEPPPATSGISEEDIARAKQAWKESAPPEFRNLLDATEEK
jgi:hypothetical protein